MPEQRKSDDREWLNDQVTIYSAAYPHFKLYSELLEKVLKRAAADLAPPAIIQSRPKAISSFAGKALLKRDKYDDPVAELTDLCGARVICRTRAQVEAMSEWVKQSFDVDYRNSVDCSERLSTAEFGYRSVHYIVEFRSDREDIYGMDIPDEILNRRAEIQIRTVVEHAYADFVHDISYKGAFRLPTTWQRELAGVAAGLEEADLTFSRIEERLTLYASNYGAYLSQEELAREIDSNTMVLEHDPDNFGLAVRVAKLAQMAEEWGKAERVLEPYVSPTAPEKAPQPVLRELGITCCKKYGPGTPEFEKGQRYLELASAPEFGDVDAICSWAGSWRHTDTKRAAEIYQKAFEIDPYDPYALGNYLEHELQQNPGALTTARPLIREAIMRCQGHAEAGVNLPWAYFDLGRFYLLLDEPELCLDAYCKAITVSSAPFMLETSLASLERMKPLSGQLRGYEPARRLLLLGLATRFDSPERRDKISPLATQGADPIEGPVLIVAGGTDPRVEKRMQSYRGLLADGLSTFSGTVISGGTTQGISGLVGDAAEANSGRFRTIGYLPDLIPKDATRDDDTSRYQEIRHSIGHGFSPLEPLQNWIDLVAAGVPISRARLLGINGGTISAAEYRMALALGARVGLVSESGREAGAIFTDPFWASTTNLLDLPEDPAVVKAFANWEPGALPEDVQESIAELIHEGYRVERFASTETDDPALADWGNLHEAYRESNRDQARHLAQKLGEIGCTYVTADSGPEVPVTFTEDEVETMARMEHGRWVVDRLLAGWRPGDTRDLERKTNPCLVEWSRLPDEEKEKDRQAVRKIPDLLRTAGLVLLRAL